PDPQICAAEVDFSFEVCDPSGMYFKWSVSAILCVACRSARNIGLNQKDMTVGQISARTWANVDQGNAGTFVLSTVPGIPADQKITDSIFCEPGNPLWSPDGRGFIITIPPDTPNPIFFGNIESIYLGVS